MRTIVSVFFAVVVSVLIARAEETVAEKTSDAVETTKRKAKKVGREVAETTEEVARSVANGTKRAAHAVVDAVTPDADAHRVKVQLSEHEIDMPKKVKPGKTAFVVKNAGKERHSFEVEGAGIDQSFLTPVGPGETKVLHVNLKRGTYKVRCPLQGDEKKGMKVTLTVR